MVCVFIDTHLTKIACVLFLIAIIPRRKRLDLIQLFKIINKFEDVDIGIDMGNNNRIEGGGRRHGFQILKERAGSYERIFFAKSKCNYLEYTTLRGSECWDSEFLSKLDEHMRSVFI